MSGESSGWASEVPTPPKNKAQVSITEVFCMASPAKRKYSNTTSRNPKNSVLSDFDLTMTLPGHNCEI
jgi:hypothetical protein